MQRLLIVLWSVMLSFVVLALIGTTSLLSNLVEATQIPLIIEVGFLTLSGIFAVLIWRFIPMPRHKLTQTLALLAPLLILSLFLT